MSLVIEDLKVPLHVDHQGTMRVGQTRVTLHSVIGEFRRGATAEEIVAEFDTLHLADVYAILGFYLKHQQEVDAHLHAYEQEGERVREELEKHYPSKGLRERLLSRRAQVPSAPAQSIPA